MTIKSTKTTFVAGTLIKSAEVNDEFSDIVDDLTDLDARVDTKFGSYGDEVLLGTVPIGIYTPQSTESAAPVILSFVNNSTAVGMYIVDRPTPPSGWALRGRLVGLLGGTLTTTTYVDLYDASAAAQVAQISSTRQAITFDYKRSSLFTLPDASHQLTPRFWTIGGGYGMVGGLSIDLVAVKT